MASVCGHIRCEGKPCRVHLPPPSEAMAPGAARVAVRAAYRDLMLHTMANDREWTLYLAEIARMDATR